MQWYSIRCIVLLIARGKCQIPMLLTRNTSLLCKITLWDILLEGDQESVQ